MTSATMPVKIIIGLICLLTVAALFIVFSDQTNKPTDTTSGVRVSGSELMVLRDFWMEEIKSDGPAKAYANFLKDAPQNNISDTHTQAHVFGEALYNISGIDGVKYCDSSFEFGCYHSFFGSAVYEEGIQALPKFDEACMDAFAGGNLPCQHGIGHGLLVYTGYDKLEEALKLCEEISWQPIGGCSSGVFMEYNFHTMESVKGENYVRPMEEDAYAPCSTLPAKHTQACYFDQVQWWLNIYSNNYTKVASLCSNLSDDKSLYEACIRGIGNFLAADMNHDPVHISRTCSNSMPNDTTNALCHEGASWLVFGNGSGKSDALLVCDGLQGTFQTDCIKIIESIQ